MIALMALRSHVTAIAVALLPAAATTLSILPAHDPANASVTVAVPRNKPTDLVAATTGPAMSDMQAVGEQAQLINAALPFASGPLHSARKFVLEGSDLDQRRALLCLSQAVYYEAGYEPLEGRRAVAQVVLNRLRHPAFPKSICGVVYQGAGSGVCQFTFVCDGALYRRPAADAWRQSEEVARAALKGYVESAVGEATHYHADYVAPRWAPLLAKVAEIGQHIFYRWPGGWGQPAAFTGRYIGEPTDPLAMRPPPPGGDVQLASATGQPMTVDTGPPVPRAPDDVGGLLDTSKGWTIQIPGPDETTGAAAKMIAEQQAGSTTATKVAAAGVTGDAAATK